MEGVLEFLGWFRRVVVIGDIVWRGWIGRVVERYQLVPVCDDVFHFFAQAVRDPLVGKRREYEVQI